MPENNESKWILYILRCADNSLYTGITNNLSRRIQEHNSDTKSAKYTRSRQPVTLVYQKHSESRSSALKQELEVKRMKKSEKEKLLI